MSLILKGFPVQPGQAPLQFENGFLYPRDGGYLHHAIDIRAQSGGDPQSVVGMPVLSATAGTVVQSFRYRGERRPGAGFSDRAGYYVMIVDTLGNFHNYTHLRDQPTVVPGERVKDGDPIGYLGQTGNARGTIPHLHYQVRGPLAARLADAYLSLNFPSTGGDPLNPYDELRRLAGELHGAPTGRGTVVVIP
jgi:murein DD-endopeptidase MepM/ murein hydrolase activator NlpD